MWSDAATRWSCAISARRTGRGLATAGPLQIRTRRGAPRRCCESGAACSPSSNLWPEPSPKWRARRTKNSLWRPHPSPSVHRKGPSLARRGRANFGAGVDGRLADHARTGAGRRAVPWKANRIFDRGHRRDGGCGERSGPESCRALLAASQVGSRGLEFRVQRRKSRPGCSNRVVVSTVRNGTPIRAGGIRSRQPVDGHGRKKALELCCAPRPLVQPLLQALRLRRGRALRVSAIRSAVSHGDRDLALMKVEQVSTMLGNDRKLARQSLVHHHPERVDVRPCLDLSADALLRRHVFGRSERVARLRKRLRRSLACSCRSRAPWKYRLRRGNVPGL